MAFTFLGWRWQVSNRRKPNNLVRKPQMSEFEKTAKRFTAFLKNMKYNLIWHRLPTPFSWLPKTTTLYLTNMRIAIYATTSNSQPQRQIGREQNHPSPTKPDPHLLPTTNRQVSPAGVLWVQMLVRLYSMLNHNKFSIFRWLASLLRPQNDRRLDIVADRVACLLVDSQLYGKAKLATRSR